MDELLRARPCPRARANGTSSALRACRLHQSAFLLVFHALFSISQKASGPEAMKWRQKAVARLRFGPHIDSPQRKNLNLERVCQCRVKGLLLSKEIAAKVTTSDIVANGEAPPSCCTIRSGTAWYSPSSSLTLTQPLLTEGGKAIPLFRAVSSN